MPEGSLLIIDESHVSVPQISGMYRGDRSRKKTLSDYGFRLPSCMDNRPLTFEEWDMMRPPTIFLSATPGPWELDLVKNKYVEQIIRPTGLIDPECEIRTTVNQVEDLIGEIKDVIKNNNRVLITTLTKKISEDLTNYLKELNFKVEYLHSEVHTMDRIKLIRALRLGEIDILVGINLLREGLDIPECGLVAILDADKEGFLRSKTSLIQTIGRAARNVDGKVILYADVKTKSIQAALEETDYRKLKQLKYNKDNNITPESVKRNIGEIIESIYEKDSYTVKLNSNNEIRPGKFESHIKKLEKKMLTAAENLDFEKAALYRDEIRKVKKDFLGINQA